MGVRGLQTFLQKQVANGVFSINILKEIHCKKRDDPDEPVLLVFQVIDLLYNIVSNLTKVEIICGPSHLKIHNIFDRCLQQLKNSGAELTFFLEGPVPSYDFQTWKRKQSVIYTDNITLIDKIDSNVPIDQIQLSDRPPGASRPLQDLLEMCKKYGTLHIPLNAKGIVDIVKYSNEKNAFAIIANNSNFLIFNGTWRYWSCRDIDLTALSWNTLEYNKFALMEHIGLNQSQLPLLATVAGNDFVPYGKVDSFHNRIHGERIIYGKEHFLKLAKYVQNLPDILSTEELRDFSSDLFGCSDSLYYKTVCDSLNFYKTESLTETEENRKMEPLLVSAAFDRVYYQSLTEGPIRIHLPSFYDLRRTDFLPFFDIESPILKRQIGLIRKHKNDTNYNQIIEIKLSHSEAHQTMTVTPEYPVVEIPDLMELTFNRTNDYFNIVRFKLLKWMVFGEDIHPQFLIEHIPEGYMVTVITVMYLVKLKQLSNVEADTILLSIHLIKENGDYATSIELPAYIITSRDLIVSHLYISLHNIIVRCFRFVGLNDFIDYLCFDGVFFIHWLNKMKMDNHEESFSQIGILKHFLRFVDG